MWALLYYPDLGVCGLLPLIPPSPVKPSSGKSHAGDQVPGWPDWGALICQLAPEAYCHLPPKLVGGIPGVRVGALRRSPIYLIHSSGKQKTYVHNVYIVLHVPISSLENPPLTSLSCGDVYRFQCSLYTHSDIHPFI